MKDPIPDKQKYAIEMALLKEKKEAKRSIDSDRFIQPCAICGVIFGILFWKWGKGLHLAPAGIPYLILLFKCYRFEGNENLITQAVKDGNLTKFGLIVALPVFTPIILFLTFN